MTRTRNPRAAADRGPAAQHQGIVTGPAAASPLEASPRITAQRQRIAAAFGAAVAQRAIAEGNQAFVGKRVQGPVGPGVILEVQGAGYAVHFDEGSSFYVPASDLDLLPGSDNDNGPKAQPSPSTGTVKGPVDRTKDTSYLNALKPETQTGGWSKGHPELTDAHHKLGKNVLAWLYEHMTEGQHAKLRTAIHLDRTSKALALTRLTSNLISTDTGLPSATPGEPKRALSGKRTDDPMNNSKTSKPGHQYLDMVETDSGALTPRSEEYFQLAHGVMDAINRRYLEYRLTTGSDGKDFRLSDEEADTVIAALRKAEALNHKIEGGTEQPSHTKEKIWTESAEDRFTKAKSQQGPVTLDESDYAAYDRDAGAVLKRRIEKRKAIVAAKIPSFKTWLNEIAPDDPEVYYSEDVDAMEDRYHEWVERTYGGQ